MELMKTYTVVGGGVCGLLCVKSLLAQGIKIAALEKNDRLAANLPPGGYRLYSQESVGYS